MYFKRLFLVIACVLIMYPGMAQQDSIKKEWYKSSYLKKSVTPVVLIGAGFFMKLNHTSFNDQSIQNDVHSRYPHFYSNADTYLAFAAIPAVYGFSWLGIKAKTDFWNRSVILVKGELIMAAAIYSMKYTTHVERPDHSDNQSFPSTHVAQVFLAAVFINKELGSKSILFPIAGYTIATAVGVMRILNNDHWTSDVLVGAGIGMLSMHAAYWTHRYKWSKSFTFLPSYTGKGIGMYASYTF